MRSPTASMYERILDDKAATAPRMVTVDLGSPYPEHDSHIVRSPLLTETKSEPINDIADATIHVIKTSSWRRFPWIGLIGLTTAILCSFTSFMVLHFSHKRAAFQWARTHVQLAPNVIISILNNLGNLGIMVAFGEGAAIYWWRRARAGSTVQQLHNSWSFSVETFGILRQLRSLNIVAFIAMVAKIAFIDGVLYQKATSTYVDTYTNFLHENITAFAAQTFPRTASFGISPTDDGHMSDKFEATFLDWDRIGSRADRSPHVYDCNGLICKFHVVAAGWAMDCTNSTSDIDYGTAATTTLTKRANSKNATASGTAKTTPDPQNTKTATETKKPKTTTESKKPKSTTESQAPKNTAEAQKPENFTKALSSSSNSPDDPNARYFDLFTTKFTRVWTPNSQNFSALQMDIAYTQFTGDTAQKDGSCPSVLTKTSCSLRPALLNYTIIYTNVSSAPLSNMKVQGANAKGKSASTVLQKSGTRLYSDCADDIVGTDEDCSRQYPERKQVDGVSFVSYLDLEDEFQAGKTSRMEGFYLAFKTRLESQSRLKYANKTFYYDTSGSQSVLSKNREINVPDGYCNFTFDDPQQYLMTRINALTLMTTQNHKLFFRENKDGSGRNESSTYRESRLDQVQNQTVTATVLYDDIFFFSDATFMYAAFSTTLAVVLCILPLFWGFWELPRRVTLSPIEVANAFHGPTFSGVRGDGIRDLMREIGPMRVMYGPVQQHSIKHQFKFV